MLVIDNGNPTLSSSTRVVVTVDDVNDNAPEFLERFYKIQIPASVISHPESVVLQVFLFIQKHAVLHRNVYNSRKKS